MFAPVYIHRLARLLAFGAVICLIACTSVSAKVVYVNANAPGAAHNGATWATAFLTIQDGLNAAVSGDDVWVAAGLYPERIVLPQPRWPWTDTSPGVRVYGGFAGTGSTPDARDWNAHPSIIDGGGEGIVVTLPPWATNTGIDGFTVRNAAPGQPLAPGAFGEGVRDSRPGVRQMYKRTRVTVPMRLAAGYPPAAVNFRHIRLERRRSWTLEPFAGLNGGATFMI